MDSSPSHQMDIRKTYDNMLHLCRLVPQSQVGVCGRKTDAFILTLNLYLAILHDIWNLRIGLHHVAKIYNSKKTFSLDYWINKRTSTLIKITGDPLYL